MFTATGGTGLYDGNQMHRQFHDIRAVGTHFVYSWDVSGTTFTKSALGPNRGTGRCNAFLNACLSEEYERPLGGVWVKLKNWSEFSHERTLRPAGLMSKFSYRDCALAGFENFVKVGCREL